MGLTVDVSAGKTRRRKGKDCVVFISMSISAQEWHVALPKIRLIVTLVRHSRHRSDTLTAWKK